MENRSEMRTPLAVQMHHITKRFGDFVANDDIDLEIRQGEIHALLGENGAGKSTLMNMLYGLLEPTEGEIYIHGKRVEMTNPNVAIAEGLGMVHQHFMLIEPFTVVENIVLGTEPKQGIVFDEKKARDETLRLSETYGLQVDPDARIQDISVGMQQRVEILKALYRGANILIFDEPTAVLTPQEIEEFCEILENLSREGKTIIIITHKLKEIKAMADRCTIIRRGKKIDTVEVSEVSESDLAEMMVGRQVLLTVEKGPLQAGENLLEVKDLVVHDARNIAKVDGCTFAVRRGEIHGIAGIDGNGQSELLEALSGLRRSESGSVILNG